MRPPLRGPMRGRDRPFGKLRAGSATAGRTPALLNPLPRRYFNFPSFFLHLHLQEFLSASTLYG